jgi:hypothetical protein
MQVFGAIAFFAIGLVQLFAIADGISYGMGWGGFASFIAAAFTTYVPLLGSVLGVYGATHAWDWGILQSIALFFWYIPFAIAFGIIGMVTDR